MKSFRNLFFLFSFILASNFALAMEKPGGLTQTAVNATQGTYEVLLSPAYLISPNGMYLSSQMRYQATEDISVGFGFGAGEVGYNFGGQGVWYVLPDTAQQPAFAILGGLYINKV